ncbi:MAG: DUF5666 domain-containing protein [Nitrospiraceae bacterium]|nr:DUF5666 domain-containing protein [Nitrospiraceae bacterium]
MKRILISAMLVAAMFFVCGSAYKDNTDYKGVRVEQDDSRYKDIRIPDPADYPNSANFYGTVKKMSAKKPSIWKIGDRDVTVTAKTSIIQKNGKVAEGAYVWVEGKLKNNVFVASKIEANRYGSRTGQKPFPPSEEKLYGLVETVSQGEPAVWTIKGASIIVSKHTKIIESNGKAGVGAYIGITGKTSGNDFVAEKIETLKNPWGSVKK